MIPRYTFAIEMLADRKWVISVQNDDRKPIFIIGVYCSPEMASNALEHVPRRWMQAQVELRKCEARSRCRLSA